MKLAITGASGFLGRYTVAEALRRGHDVRAWMRPSADEARLPWHDHPRVSIVRADLRSRRGLAEALAETDAVIHCAAAVGGDLYTQLAGTVVATENLLHAMRSAGVNRLVLISSFSVYEWLNKPSFSLLDESSPLEHRLYERDDYCLAKVLQERLARAFAAEHGLALTVARPGLLYGCEHVWTAFLGAQAGERTWVRIGAWAQLPLAYVENCAEAALLCAEKGGAVGETFNVVDDNTPSHRAYLRALQARMTPPPRVIPVAWLLMRMLARLAWVINKLALRGEGKLPGILIPTRLHARCKPLRYTNRHLREQLGWTPRYGLSQALDRSIRPEEELLNVRISEAPVP
jgi:nucleoside-diphosphate-sugar epimerase